MENILKDKNTETLKGATTDRNTDMPAAHGAGAATAAGRLSLSPYHRQPWHGTALCGPPGTRASELSTPGTPASINRAALVSTPATAGVLSSAPLSVTPTYFANFTVAAFRGTNPVWNWIWNIFMDAICREKANRRSSGREGNARPFTGDQLRPHTGLQGQGHTEAGAAP